MLRTVRDLGAAVRRTRQAAGLSQQSLAVEARVSRQWLSRFEAGKNPAAELQKVLDVLGALGLAVDLIRVPELESENADPFADLFEGDRWRQS